MRIQEQYRIRTEGYQEQKVQEKLGAKKKGVSITIS